MGAPWILVILAWMAIIPVAYPVLWLTQFVEQIWESIVRLFGFIG